MYQNYSDPLGFLNTSFETVGIIETVSRVCKDDNDSKLWEMYLSFKPEKKSFDDWKCGVSGGIPTYTNTKNLGTKNKEETEKIIKNAEKILSGFKRGSKAKGR